MSPVKRVAPRNKINVEDKGSKKKAKVVEEKKKSKEVVEESSEEEEEDEYALYDPEVFISEKAFFTFQKLVSKRISTGSYVRFDEIEEYRLRTLLEYQGWGYFFTITGTTYANYVRLFYANMTSHSDSATRLVCQVNRRKFVVNPEKLARLLRIPAEGVDIFNENLETFEYPEGFSKEEASKLLHGDDYPNLSSDPTTKSLVVRARVLANLLGHTIIPKTGSRDRLYGCHKLLTFCILAKIRVNLPLLLINEMWNLREGSSNLYYGKIITKILEDSSISFDNQKDVVKVDKHFGAFNVNLMKPTEPSDPTPRPSPRPTGVAQGEASAQVQPQPEFVTMLNEFKEQIFARMDVVQVETRLMYDQAQKHLEYHMDHLYRNLNIAPPPPFNPNT